MKADLIGVVEAVYADAGDDTAWLRGIIDASFPIVDVGLGTLAYTFIADPKAGVSIIDASATGAYGAELLESAYCMQAEAGPRAMVAFQSQVSLLTEVAIPPHVDDDFIERHFKRLGGIGNAEDVLGIVAADSSGKGVVLSSFRPGKSRLSPAFRHRWQHVVAHLASGMRLRSAAERPSDEAVLDGGGKLYDAFGKATSRDAQLALRQAARAIDRARVRRSRAPEEALEAWHALVDARWSLVDRFESDGRRYLIARPNPPRPPPIRPLTARERAVVALVALGRSNKLIAYELGLSVGTVGNYVTRAQQKLGMTSRAALIRMFHAALGQRVGADDEGLGERR